MGFERFIRNPVKITMFFLARRQEPRGDAWRQWSIRQQLLELNRTFVLVLVTAHNLHVVTED